MIVLTRTRKRAPVTPTSASDIPTTVWIVDDEWVIATTLAALLRYSGFDVTIFFNPLETLKAAENKRPDILISDVMMPGISGIELGVRLNNIHPTCRVILFSGHTSAPDILSRARVDGHDFELLTKPVNPDDLLAVLRHDGL
jgi:DNA-binding NtrC family response regulator